MANEGHHACPGYSSFDHYLETCRAPVDELDGPLGLDLGDGCVYVLGYHITSETTLKIATNSGRDA